VPKVKHKFYGYLNSRPVSPRNHPFSSPIQSQLLPSAITCTSERISEAVATASCINLCNLSALPSVRESIRKLLKCHLCGRREQRTVREREERRCWKKAAKPQAICYIALHTFRGAFADSLSKMANMAARQLPLWQFVNALACGKAKQMCALPKQKATPSRKSL